MPLLQKLELGRFAKPNEKNENQKAENDEQGGEKEEEEEEEEYFQIRPENVMSNEQSI